MGKRIIIIGGGFAGLAAARALRRHGSGVTVTLIDPRASSHFLPLLPDIVGGRVPSFAAATPFERLSGRLNFAHLQATANGIDTEERTVTCGHHVLHADALIVATGSETNFHGNAEAERQALKLDDQTDAGHLVEASRRPSVHAIVIIGGGYTGIEVATHLRCRLNREGRRTRLVIVERAPTVLPSLPSWMQVYAAKSLAQLDVEVFPDCAFSEAHNGTVRLSNGSVFEDALLFWATGVHATPLLRGMREKRDPWDRLVVDENLQVRDGVFCAGDAACVTDNGKPLRMAVQFAIAEGARAGANALRRLKGKAPKPCRPRDLGYIIPMANGRSFGNALGVNLRGAPASFLHYAMCAYRGQDLRARACLARALIHRPTRRPT